MKTIPFYSVLFLLVVGMSTTALASTKPLIKKVTDVCMNEKNYPEIEKKELQDLVALKKVFTIDANSEESFKKAHIGDSTIHYTHQKDLAKLLPADKGAMIVAYCGGPECTAWKKAAVDACKAGYTNIHHFKGGISGWVKN